MPTKKLTIGKKMPEKEKLVNWLKSNDACASGYKWAIESCVSMSEVWETAKPEWLLWVATRTNVCSKKEMQEFALFCAGRVRHLMADKRSTDALDLCRKFLDGTATDEQMRSALDAARDAESAAWAARVAMAAARAARAASEECEESAESASWAARAAVAAAREARAASEESAESAAWAAWAAREAVAAAREEEENAQCEWLKTNCSPNFE